MEEKKTDWKQILGMAIIFGLLMYIMLNNQSDEPAKDATATTIEEAGTTAAPATAVAQLPDSLPVATRGEVLDFSNELIDFEIDTKGGVISKALLKNFRTYDSLPVYLVKGNDHKFNLSFRTQDGRLMNTENLVFTPEFSNNGENKVLSLKWQQGAGQYLEYRYELKPADYMMDFVIRSQGLSSVFDTSKPAELEWQMTAYRRSKSMSNENRYTEIKFEYDGGSDDYTGQGETADEQEENVSYIAYKQHFFASYPAHGYSVQQCLDGVPQSCRDR